METNFRQQFSLSPYSRSYPTYEEWKHSKFVVYSITLVWFLSYLRGMETSIEVYQIISIFHRSYPTYEEWKPENVVRSVSGN